MIEIFCDSYISTERLCQATTATPPKIMLSSFSSVQVEAVPLYLACAGEAPLGPAERKSKGGAGVGISLSAALGLGISNFPHFEGKSPSPHDDTISLYGVRLRIEGVR